MDGIQGRKAVFQLRKQVKTLALLPTEVKIQVETVHIHENHQLQVLFLKQVCCGKLLNSF